MTRIPIAVAAFLAPLAMAVARPGPAVAQSGGAVLVSTAWLAEHLRDRDLVVIHTAAQQSDYAAGHIPGARWLPPGAFTRSHGGLSSELPDPATLDSALESLGVTNRSRIVISGGPITMTSRLFYTLDYFGLGKRVSLLDGGIAAWREEGRALEREAPAMARGDVTLRPHVERRVEAPWIATRTSVPPSNVKVLDARLPEFWQGVASNKDNPRPGRVPTAANIPFTSLTGELSRFRDRDHLSQLFERAGVQAGDTVVTYCQTGMQGSVLFVAARLLGYEAALYDGSFEDWSRRRELPVAGTDTTRR